MTHFLHVCYFHYHYHYQGQGNRLVGSSFNSIYVYLLATESPCTFLDVKADRDCKTEIFLGNSPGYHLIDLIHLIGCVILRMSLQDLIDYRNFMVSMETKWQAALCFAHG